MEQKWTIIIVLLLAVGLRGESCVEYREGKCVKCQEGWVEMNGGCVKMGEVGRAWKQYGGGYCGCTENNCFVPAMPFESQYRQPSGEQVTLYALAFGQGQPTPKITTTTTTTTVTTTTFTHISITQAKSQPGFLKCDSALKSSKYGQLISRASTPWHQISLLPRQQTTIYRIVYWTLGGGILQCLIQYSQSAMKANLGLVVEVPASKIVHNCQDYAPQMYCQVCREGFHLDRGLCFANINGCTEYYGPICLSCVQWSVLVQNRCLLQCSLLGDLNHKQFYGDMACI